LIFADGILDVLDHATPTTGYGSKLAIDLTDVHLSATDDELYMPNGISLCAGLCGLNVELFDELGLLMLFVDSERRDVDVEAFLERSGIRARYVVLFDGGAAEGMTYSDLLWIAAANTDPRRDIRVYEKTLIIDAQSKRPGVGRNPKRFPNVVTSTMDVVEMVDKRWSEYGFEEFVESPSRKYRALLLSDKEDW
jgi:4-hydroxy-3-polyprenylbenzoate decarboxylase